MTPPQWLVFRLSALRGVPRLRRSAEPPQPKFHAGVIRPAVGTDHPSQDRRSLADLVSSPPLATDHESRLHQLAGDAALQPQAAEGERVDGWLGATA